MPRYSLAEGGFPHLQIGSFRDPQLRNGVFILQLLRAVAPECVQADEILPGKNASECKLNAKYAISCAHKMGCRVFCTWEDIVEARPKMIIWLFAAAMAEDMRRQGLKKEELLEQVKIVADKMGNVPFALYLDRLPMHRSNWLRDRLQEMQVTRILGATTSPQYNAIEGCFSVVKNHFKRQRLHYLANKKDFVVTK